MILPNIRIFRTLRVDLQAEGVLLMLLVLPLPFPLSISWTRKPEGSGTTTRESESASSFFLRPTDTILTLWPCQRFPVSAAYMVRSFWGISLPQCMSPWFYLWSSEVILILSLCHFRWQLIWYHLHTGLHISHKASQGLSGLQVLGMYMLSRISDTKLTNVG